jgi:nitrite reductase/ring-hydroxylating ferredoxin subunit
VTSHRVSLSVFGGSDRALVTLAGREIALFRMGGEVRAFANACPHEGNPLIDGEIRGMHLRCVYHLWEFDLETGACLSGEAPATTYRTAIVGDEVVIEQR